MSVKIKGNYVKTNVLIEMELLASIDKIARFTRISNCLLFVKDILLETGKSTP